MLRDHSSDLTSFVRDDERGRRLLGYLGKAANAFSEEKRLVLEELDALTRSVDHMKDVVATQQTYAGSTHLAEPVQIESLIEDALRMNSGSRVRERVRIRKDIAPLPEVLLDKHLLLQILVNLISNAQHAVETHLDREPVITLQVNEIVAAGDERRLRINVSDDGAGIAPEHMAQLFQHGFTTRKKGHGFGLHSCALAAKSMGGTLTADSEGPGRGAIFTLVLPLRMDVAGAEARAA
jgi:C4-dicarboxylate-specific signal transduction histidine kinase